MTREAYIVSEELIKYKNEPNLFYRAFELQYRKMFRSTDSLIDQEVLKDWFVEQVDTIRDLIKFVTLPVQDSPGLCILRGWTGIGKTTSVRVLFEKMQDRLPKTLVYLYLQCSTLMPSVELIDKEFNMEIYAKLEKQFGNNYFKNVSQSDETYVANTKRLNQLVSEGKTIIAVWDNVDQCSRQVQMECLRLIHSRLNRIKRLKIIVTIREYNFSRAHTELANATFDNFPITHLPLSIEQVLKVREGLSQRTMREELGDDSKPFDLGEGIQVTIGHGRRFLARIINDLCRPEISRALARLSNTNLRVQLEMAHHALKTPYITRRVALETIRKYYEQDRDEILLPYHMFIEGLLIGSSTDCYSVFSFGDSTLINMFNAGDINAYYNTLNRHHVAEIVSKITTGINVGRIEQELETLGHDKSCTSTSIKEFLSCGLVWSEEGSVEDYPSKISTILPTKATNYYIRTLQSKLIYLQHMGLVTPLEEQFRTGIRHWTMEEEEVDSFRDRMTSTKALLQQIAADEDEEINLTKKSPAALAIMQRYRFGNISGEMGKQVLKEVQAIRSSSRMPIPENEWIDVIEGFKPIADRAPCI